MTKLNISDAWISQIIREGTQARDTYTFRGALEYRYSHISMYWNDSTKKKYEREYNNIIIPALKDHNEKTMREYTKSDYLEALQRIREKGYIVNGIKHSYTESTIKHFGNLIYYVVYYASEYGLCDNVLWGSEFEVDTFSERDEIEEKTFLKKSLSIKQEYELANELLEDAYEEGEKVALLLMWGLGLRNGEACGLNYGDIKPLRGHDDCCVAWIYKSTQIKSRALQAGGKTVNTGRIIPVPEVILEFLKKRKIIIEQLLIECNSSLNIDELPICNSGELNNNNFFIRCKADEITAAACKVFETVDISSRQIAYLDRELSESNVADMLKEKEPTAYLLRRNFATQMQILGLKISEIQYLIGHDVEDAYESRNAFVDGDRIYSMYTKLKQREVLNYIASKKNDAEICIRKGKKVKIHISANEIMDTVNICIRTSKDKIQWYSSAAESYEKREIDVNKQYHAEYSSIIRE